jgi:hypothetical protein
MKTRLFQSTILAILLLGPITASPSSWAATIIIDHTCTEISKVPQTWIDQAKAYMRVTYGHTSHGSQLVTGIEASLGDPGSAYYCTISGYGYDAEAFLNDYGMPGAEDLGNPDRTTWASATRDLLNQAGGCNRNVVMWSWCGQVDATPEEISTYLSLMNQLEIDFPHVTFVYMTGHLDGSGQDGNVNLRNDQIRSYCRTHNKVLFDFADIESYDPDGLTNFMVLHADDGCYYSGGNWAQQWIAGHPGSELAQRAAACGDCQHSEKLNCVLKGRAFWWMMARLAGWPGPGPTRSTQPGVPLLLLNNERGSQP